MVWGPNKVREKLNKGQIVAGSVVLTWSPNIMEAAGYAGLDFMRIDGEHTWRQDSSMEHLVLAARYAGIEPILRIDRDNPYLVRKALELGAGGIIVPQIESVADAAAVVAAAKFPPRGIRGYSSSCHAGGWGTKTGPAYVEWSDTQPMIGIMIETAKALDCVEEIMAVDGVDFTLFGPADLSLSFGFRKPDPNHEKVQAALRRTIAAARKVGKHVMLGIGAAPDRIKKHAEMGVTMLELDTDLGIANKVWADCSRTIAAIARPG